MNPTDSNHWVYRRFIERTHRIVEYDGVPVQISTHPGVCHIHTTYLDNRENLSQEFLSEVEEMKASNPEKYAHVVMGQWADVAEGAIYKGWGVVKEFPQWCKQAPHVPIFLSQLNYHCKALKFLQYFLLFCKNTMPA